MKLEKIIKAQKAFMRADGQKDSCCIEYKEKYVWTDGIVMMLSDYRTDTVSKTHRIFPVETVTKFMDNTIDTLFIDENKLSSDLFFTSKYKRGYYEEMTHAIRELPMMINTGLLLGLPTDVFMNCYAYKSKADKSPLGLKLATGEIIIIGCFVRLS